MPSQNDLPSISHATLLARLQANDLPGHRYQLVDLRRNDHEGGTIRGSINLPAQTLHLSLPALYRLCVAAGVEEVVFYCGSSRGRGPRGAGQLARYVEEKQGSIKSVVLEGGIKGWVAGGEEYVAFMDDFAEGSWRQEEKNE